MIKFIIFSTITLIAASPLLAQYNPPIEAHARWDAASYGDPAVKYIIQHSVNGLQWYPYAIVDTTYATMSVSYLDTDRIRVAGIDAGDRMSPWSEPSKIYIPADSLCGIPTEPLVTLDPAGG